MNVAFPTNRNNVKPMLRGITLMMMILFCLFATGAFQGVGSRQFTNFDGFANSRTGFNLFGAFFSLPVSDGCFSLCALEITVFCSVAFFTLLITFLLNFKLFAFGVSFCCGLALFCSIVTKISFAMRYFAFFCLAIFFYAFQVAYFAFIPMSILTVLILVKLRKWLCLLANSAGFRYGLLRHNQLLGSWLCSEPIAEPISVLGSLYNMANILHSQRKNNILR